MANLKEAFEYASQNPDSDFARNLEQLASTGSLNKEAQKYGIDLSPFQQKKTLPEQLGERAKTFASEVTLKPTRDMLSADANTTGQERELAGLAGINRAFQSPIRAVGAIGGAIGDVVGAGLEATGLDKPIAQALQPVVQSDPVQKAMQVYQTLPKETQDVLGAIMNTANIPLAGGVKSVAQSGIKNVADIKNLVPTKLGQKAVDLISQDPGKKVETILKRTNPDELNNYLSIAEKSSLSGEAKSVFETVGDKLADTTKLLDVKLKEIGRAKSDIVTPLREGLGAFKKETSPLIEKLTSLKNNLSEIDKGQRSTIQAVINDAKTVATKRDADMFIDKVQNALYTGNKDMTIPKGSALDKQLRGLLGEYNNSLKASLPTEYSALNKRYSELIDTLDTINTSLGEVVEGVPVRGASLIKQYFSPAGSKAKEIFEFIKKETNGEVDLAKDATLAKFAGQLYDDPNVGSLLGGIKDVPTSLTGAISRVAEKIGGEKVESLMRQSTIRKARQTISPKAGLESGSKTIDRLEKELFPFVESTPKEIKGKGIRGMINFSEWIPDLKAQVKSAESALSTGEKVIVAEDLGSTLSKMGINVGPVTKNNVDDVIETAKKAISDERIIAKKEAMSTPAVKEMQSRFIKNPTTGKLEGSSKKKVVSSLEQEAKGKIVSSQNEWVKDTFWGKSIRNDATETTIPISEIGGGKLIGIRQNNVTDNGVKEWVARIKKGERPTVLIGNKKSGDKGIVVLDGNHRLEAYRQLGIKEIPIVDNTGGKLKRK